MKSDLKKKPLFDLEERTAKFGEKVIDLCKNLEKNIIDKVLINQLVRSATSVGANYMEANSASSGKDFRNKIYICKKEIQETKHWLRMLAHSINNNDKTKILWNEAEELTLIFGRIISTLDGKNSE